MIKIFIIFFSYFFSIQSFAKDSSVLLEKEINITLENIAGLNLEKEQLESNIHEMQIKIKERRLQISNRVHALSYLKKYQWGNFFSENSSTTLERNFKILNELNYYDLNLFKEYRASLKLLGQSRRDLDATQEQLKSRVSLLKQQQQDLLESEKLRLKEMATAKTNSLLKQKGNLTRPLDGIIAITFGAKSDYQNQYTFVSKGLSYKNDLRQPVKSIGPGVIIFRDHLQYWRETLIVQHDDNYFSIYTGLNDVLKNINDHVDQGENLGVTASSEFYFELRHFDNPINPQSWFREL